MLARHTLPCSYTLPISHTASSTDFLSLRSMARSSTVTSLFTKSHRYFIFRILSIVHYHLCHPYSLLPWGAITLGQRFLSYQLFSEAFEEWCIAENFTVWKGKKESDITTAHCAVNGCPFYISAALGGEGGVAVNVFRSEHNCGFTASIVPYM